MGKLDIEKVSSAYTAQQDMRKINVSVRIPPELFSKLEGLSQTTKLTMTDLVTEAIAQYCGVNVETVGGRLEKLERDMEALQRKFRLLGGS